MHALFSMFSRCLIRVCVPNILSSSCAQQKKGPASENPWPAVVYPVSATRGTSCTEELRQEGLTHCTSRVPGRPADLDMGMCARVMGDG